MTHRPEEIVGDNFPYGQWDGYSTVNAAATLAELVRHLNHATRNPDAVPWPSTVGDVLGNLAGAVAGMDQLLDQLNTRFRALAANPDSYVDGGNGVGGQPVPTVLDAAANLSELLEVARQGTEKMAGLMGAAQTYASRVGIRTDDTDEETNA